MNRRDYLATTGAFAALGSLSALAGCVGRSADPQAAGELVVSITNQDATAHRVSVQVTDSRDATIAKMATTEIPPSVARTFTAAADGDDALFIAVEETGTPYWKQGTRWSDRERCPRLTYFVRITRHEGRLAIVGRELCESR